MFCIKSERRKVSDFKKKYLSESKGFLYCILVLLLVSLFAGCANERESGRSKKNKEKISSQTTVSQNDVEKDNAKTDEKSEENKDSKNNSGSESKPAKKTRSEIDKKYLELLKEADDENDFKYASDYRQIATIYLFGHDASSYKAIFGYCKPSEQDIYKTIDSNTNLTSEDKKFIKEFVTDWLTLYPESDLTVLDYNLRTLVIERLSSDVIKARTLSSGTVACYIDWMNTIYLDENSVISDKASNDYVALVHELLHVCRLNKSKVGDITIKTSFYDDTSFGLYENEALATYYAFKMRQYHVPDAEMKSIYYTLQCSIYRVLLPLMDYDGNDYMNHSINYFVEKIQDCFNENGINAKAYHFVNLVDSQALMHYSPYETPDFDNFEEEFEILVNLYATTHLTPQMTEEEIRNEFNVFWEDLSFNLAKLTTPYEEMKRETFEGYWNVYVEKMNNTSE